MELVRDKDEPQKEEFIVTSKQRELWEKYVSFVNSKAAPQENLTNHILHGSIGAVEEYGELMNLIKKKLFYKKEVDKLLFLEELGDVLFYSTLALLHANKEKVLDNYFISALFTVNESIDDPDTPKDFNEEALAVIMSPLEYEKRFILSDIFEIKEREENILIIFALYNFTNALFKSLFIGAIMEFTLEEIIEGNMKKLSARYKDKFTKEEAASRNIEAEYEAMKE